MTTLTFSTEARSYALMTAPGLYVAADTSFGFIDPLYAGPDLDDAIEAMREEAAAPARLQELARRTRTPNDAEEINLDAEHLTSGVAFFYFVEGCSNGEFEEIFGSLEDAIRFQNQLPVSAESDLKTHTGIILRSSSKDQLYEHQSLNTLRQMEIRRGVTIRFNPPAEAPQARPQHRPSGQDRNL